MKTWLKAIIEQGRKVGPNVSDANNRSRWRLGINTICRMMRQIRPLPLFRDKTGLLLLYSVVTLLHPVLVSSICSSDSR